MRGNWQVDLSFQMSSYLLCYHICCPMDDINQAGSDKRSDHKICSPICPPAFPDQKAHPPEAEQISNSSRQDWAMCPQAPVLLPEKRSIHRPVPHHEIPNNGKLIHQIAFPNRHTYNIFVRGDISSIPVSRNDTSPQDGLTAET